MTTFEGWGISIKAWPFKRWKWDFSRMERLTWYRLADLPQKAVISKHSLWSQFLDEKTDQSLKNFHKELALFVGKMTLKAQNWETPPKILRPPEPGSGACD